MIYVDTSVVLAYVLSESRRPPDDLLLQPLVSSRLLEYESWVRLHAYGLGEHAGDALRSVLARLAFVELHPTVLTRVLDPFPTAVRTLDAMHLATAVFVRDQLRSLSLVSYDHRMRDAAQRLGIEVTTLP